jgi:hypothetical protein
MNNAKNPKKTIDKMPNPCYNVYIRKRETKERKTMKLVINTCYGGLKLSDKAKEMLDKNAYALERDDPKLVEVVETLGSKEASGPYALLKVVELPDNTTDYDVHEYDGYESLVYVVDGKLHWLSD